MRPPSRAEEEEGAGEDVCVRKTGTSSVEIQGQGFTFDSVADEASTQVRLLQLAQEFGIFLAGSNFTSMGGYAGWKLANLVLFLVRF